MHPLAKTIAAQLADRLSHHGIDPVGRTLLCGLSGGADSVALVCLLQEMGLDVEAMHVNFQLRGAESDRDEGFVRTFCAERGMALHVLHCDTRAEAARTGESIEMAARRLRYDWFSELAEQCGGIVCVAHHADDNVETMLLNLLRGAGLHGLTGMEWVNDRGVVRPLLGTPRQALLDYLRDIGQPYITDSSNTDLRYRRNRVRHELLPLLRTFNPSIEQTLQATMDHLREAEEMLDDSEAATFYRQRRHLVQCGFTMKQIRDMEQAREGAIATAGPYLLTRHRGELKVALRPVPIPPTLLLNLSDQPDDAGAPAEPVGVSLGRAENDEPRRLTARLQPRKAIGSLKERDTVHIDVRAVHGRVIVRSVSPADRFRPYGLRGTKLVSDYLTDRHRSRIEKAAALVVCDEDGILWLVGETIAQRAAVKRSTAQVLTLSISGLS